MLLRYKNQSTKYFLRVYCRLNFNQCMICLHPSQSPMCQACYDQLPFIQQACPICSEPAKHEHICGRCLSQPPSFDRVIAPFLFKPPVSHWIHHWKQHPRVLPMRQITNALIERLREQQYDAITYVPYHWRTTLRRGRAAVVELAHELGRGLQLPVYSVFRAHTYSAPQHRLNRKQRLSRKNQRFQIRVKFQMPAAHKHWLLVDDVVTTGATANGLAKQLLRLGARSVTVAALARTPKNR